VPPDAQDRIFDRFYRVDVESVRRGSGLGLAVVKAIAHAHGGTVTLESEPGRTVFALHMPCVPGPASPARITDFSSVSFA
jgi:two-component system OmpR family sensor kinase